MRLLNFSIYGYAILIILHGLGVNFSYIEIFGGALIFISAYLLNKNYFFYIIISSLVILFSAFYGYKIAKEITFFPIMMCAISFFLLIGILFEILSIYLKR